MKKVCSDNQMMQPLESRRMMSTTPGIEAASAMFAPPAALIVQAHLPQESADPFASDAGANPIDPQPGFGGFHFEMDAVSVQDFENQMAAAIAQGASITISPAIGMDSQHVAPEAAKPATLSDLYATLGNSTVVEIDNATSSVAPATRTAVVASIESLSSTNASADLTGGFAGTNTEASQLTAASEITKPTAPVPVSGSLLASMAKPTTAESASPADLGLTSVSSSTTTQPQQVQLAPSASLVSRDAVQSLERQLAAIQTYSREIVMNMGRTQTGELSQMVTAATTADEAHSISGWKTYAAVVGAAVAGVVYTQNEIVRGKKKVDAIFSSRLIHTPAM